jgi:hypothetical protein
VCLVHSVVWAAIGESFLFILVVALKNNSTNRCLPKIIFRLLQLRL